MASYSPVFKDGTGLEKCSFPPLEPAMIQFMFNKFVQIGKTALHYPAENGHEQVAQTLLTSEADLYATTDEVYD